MLDALDTVKWAQIAQPETNRPNEVPDTLRSLLTVATQGEAELGYHRVLAAIGNDHAGTYYPVAVPVVPFLGELLSHQNFFTRKAVLNVLIDLQTSFKPAPGYDLLPPAVGAPKSVPTALRRAVEGIRENVQRCAEQNATGEERELALELLSSISR
jgi:hypothetical protein